MQSQLSLGTAAARNLATTTKSVPQMQGISSRWLLRMLPWVQVSGGTYRVNRRLTYAVGGGLVSFSQTAGEFRVVPPSLREIPVLAGFADEEVLAELAQRFVQRQVEAGSAIVERGGPIEELHVVAHGRVVPRGSGAFDEDTRLDVVTDGEYIGDELLTDAEATWEFTAVAETTSTVLSLSRQQYEAILEQSGTLREQIEWYQRTIESPQNKSGEADIALAAGHSGEPDLPQTFADYELAPREYQLSVAQTVLRIHTRVADLYNEPMNQVEQQLRLTVQALKERQEDQLINDTEFGLLHNVDRRQRISTHAGPPTPDDMDELLSRRRSTRFFLAHPRTIAAFGKECNRRGIYPGGAEVQGSTLPAWRGVPIFPCGKIPITAERTSSILAMRTGEDDQGVIGLHQTGLPDEYEPSLNVRFMGISEKGIMSYLVSVYFSAAVLVPDALGVLENVEISRS